MTTLSHTQYKQPSGLYNLCFVELWERFGFYSVQALLILFLTKGKHFSDTQAYAFFSAFSALIYATPVIGGYIADRLLGYRYSILLGTIIYILGYFALASTNAFLFCPALALLICANGFFKGCISSLVGTLYQEHDPRRDSGFTLFYMGINIGSFLAPIICSWAAVTFGWGYGFSLAGIGMIIGLATAMIGFKKFGSKGLPPDPQRLTAPLFLGISRQIYFFIALIIAILLVSWLINYAIWINRAFIAFSIFTVIMVGIFTFRYEKIQRNKMLLLIILMIFAVFFWALFLQIYSSITLFADRIVDRQLLGYVIPASVYSSIEPFFIVTLSPLLALLWIRLHNHRWNPSLPQKFSLGILLTGIAFLMLSLGVHLADSNGYVWQGWIPISYFFITLGELCLSPIGLAMVTALAPSNLTGTMMGVWFLTIALGFAVGEHIANLTSIPANITDIHMIGITYDHMFNQFGWIAVAIGVLLMLLSPVLKRMINGY